MGEDMTLQVGDVTELLICVTQRTNKIIWWGDLKLINGKAGEIGTVAVQLKGQRDARSLLQKINEQRTSSLL